ncbi:unnamed protein product [Effrenium voratum]|uniref:Uncharacterized protein n=1 Tax=Effrenium voratum TaxID=2562239 RepID=A0AA36IU78_9DINO|nr:unnamed protein product [Effrenium voratum]
MAEVDMGHSGFLLPRKGWNGDDTFGFYEQASESAILNGELFRENERLFLKQNLRLSSVSFPIGGENTVEIEVKAFWQPEAIHFKGTGSRPGRFVTLLSDIQHPIRDVWAWIKKPGVNGELAEALVRPLYKKGFSVVMLDMPGSGGSAANAELTVDYSVWEAEDWRIVEAAMRGSGQRKPGGPRTPVDGRNPRTTK